MTDAEETSSRRNSVNSVAKTATKENELTETQNNTLAQFDNAKFGWVHVKTCLVSGIGFFTVS